MLTHVHPSPLRFASRTRLGLSKPILNRHNVRDRLRPSPPSVQSPFAHPRCYLRWGDVSHHLRGRYPSFIAHTGSCVRPHPSRRLRSLPWSAGLCRLPSAPAGRWPFPTLFPRIFLYVQGPLPRRLLWCTHPFLPTRHRPSQRRHPVGALANNHALATSAWANFRGCSHLVTFKPVDLLATPIAPTVTPLSIRQPWLLRPRISRFVTSPSRGYANRLNRAIGGRGTLTLLD